MSDLGCSMRAAVARRDLRGWAPCVLGLALSVVASAAWSQEAVYQGRLTDSSGTPLTGTVTLLELRIYNDPTAGQSLYEEFHLNVPLSDVGAFSVPLGGGIPQFLTYDASLFPGTVPRYLEVRVNNELLSPRQRIGTVPTALVAEEWVGDAALQNQVTNSQSAADSAQNTADTAVTNAAAAQSTADTAVMDAATAQSTADNAQSTADTAVTNAGAAQSTADTAVMDAATAQSTADNAQVKVTGSCPAGEAIRAIATDGTVICEADNNTQLSESQVDTFVANNNFSTGAHTTDTNTQLSNAQVAAAALAQGFVTGAHTADTTLNEAQVDGFVANNGFGLAADVSANTLDVAALEAAVAALQARVDLLRFTACADGLTVADNLTGLLWERKTMTPGVHDVTNTYSWCTGFDAVRDGTAYTVFLADLNTEPPFADHTGWRLPTISEFQSIMVGPGVTTVAVASPPDPAAGTNPTRQATTCSAPPCIDPALALVGGLPTSSGYWSDSDSPLAGSRPDPWSAFFHNGTVTDFSFCSQAGAVRAVRTGSCTD